MNFFSITLLLCCSSIDLLNGQLRFKKREFGENANSKIWKDADSELANNEANSRKFDWYENSSSTKKYAIQKSWSLAKRNKAGDEIWSENRQEYQKQLRKINLRADEVNRDCKYEHVTKMTEHFKLFNLIPTQHHFLLFQSSDKECSDMRLDMYPDQKIESKVGRSNLRNKKVRPMYFFTVSDLKYVLDTKHDDGSSRYVKEDKMTFAAASAMTLDSLLEAINERGAERFSVLAHFPFKLPCWASDPQGRPDENCQTFRDAFWQLLSTY